MVGGSVRAGSVEVKTEREFTLKILLAAIWCSYQVSLNINCLGWLCAPQRRRWLLSCIHAWLAVCLRLSSCTSGLRLRSAVRLWKELWSCPHQGRSKPVLHVTRVSSSPTLPPVIPATKVSTQTEQVHNQYTPHTLSYMYVRLRGLFCTVIHVYQDVHQANLPLKGVPQQVSL